MSKSHVSQKLSAYVLGELPADETREVAAHLLACHRCRREYEEIKLGSTLASHLRPVDAPADLWAEVATKLDQPRRPWPTTEMLGGLSLPFTWPRLLAITAALILALGLGWYLWRASSPGSQMVHKPAPEPAPIRPEPIPEPPIPEPPLLPAPAPSVAPLQAGRKSKPTRKLAIGSGSRGFEVLSLDGAPTVAAARIEERGRLGIGQWLETDESSRAQIKVAEIGQIEVDPNSRIGLLASSPTEHRLKLARGRLEASIYAPPRIFIVETPSATAIDLGCEYTLEVDESGASLLRVTSGYVSLEDKRRQVIVPAGAMSETRPGRGPGTPYFADATADFRRALAQFDATGAEATTLAQILSNARRRDTLTLWHLLSFVSPSWRGAVFDRLVELFAPPEEVTREGALKLNPKMLESYRKRLEWVW